VDELAGVDLNLLVVLNALLCERHVTRAGTSVGLSQPATSNALNRLRRMFGDPLLVRTGPRMELTPRALALRDPVRAALDAIRAAFADLDAFDPATVKARIRISTTDHVLLVLLPELEQRLLEQAPGIALDIQQFGALDNLEMLGSDQLDMVIGLVPSRPDWTRARHLFHDEVLCLLRADHPALEGTDGPEDALDLERFLAYPHLRVAPRATHVGVMAEALSERRRDRHIACEVPDFLAAPFLLEKTELITVLSARVARRFTRLFPLTTRRVPLPLPGFDTDMVWHARSNGVHLHEWLRALVVDVAMAADDREEVGTVPGIPHVAVMPASTGSVTPVT